MLLLRVLRVLRVPLERLEPLAALAALERLGLYHAGVQLIAAAGGPRPLLGRDQVGH